MACTMRKGAFGHLHKRVFLDQPLQSAQADPRRHFMTTLDFLRQYTCAKQKATQKRKESSRISLHRLIGDDAFRKCPSGLYGVLQAIWQ